MYNFEYLKNILLNRRVPELRETAKRLGLKCLSKLKKQECIDLILKRLAVQYIQRRIRRTLSVNERCMISLEPIRYPCWGKKTKTVCRYYYYNLVPLIEYLLHNGVERAQDPSTHEKYSSAELRSIHSLYHTYKLHKQFGVNNLFRAITERKVHYRNIRENEEQIDLLIDLLLKIVWNMKNKVIQYRDEYIPHSLNIKRAKKTLAQKFEFASLSYIPKLHDLNRVWLKKAFKMMYGVIETIEIKPNQFELHELKGECIRLLDQENKKYCSFER